MAAQSIAVVHKNFCCRGRENPQTLFVMFDRLPCHSAFGGILLFIFLFSSIDSSR
jgi:hypothetical protein